MSSVLTFQHTKRSAAEAPLLVSFPGGPPPTDVLAADAEPSARLQISSQLEPKKKKHKIITASTPKIKYSGKTGEASLSRYIIGVHNKATGKVDLVDVEHFVKLNQSVIGVANSVQDNATENMSFIDQRTALTNTFGSKKSRTVAKSAVANAVHADSVAGGVALQQMLREKSDAAQAAGIGSGQALDGATLALQASRANFLPAFDANATTPAGVYKPKSIISPEEWNALKVEVDNLVVTLKEAEGGVQGWVNATREQNDDVRRVGRWPEYVLRHIAAMAKPKKHKQTLLVLCYCRHLLSFYFLPMNIKKSVEELEEAMGASPVIIRRFLSTFAEETSGGGRRPSYSRTSQLKDKLLVHVLALALAADECRLDPTVLCQDLRMPPQKSLTYFRELGCRADSIRKRKAGEAEAGNSADTISQSSSSSTYAVSLSVPLTFPKQKNGGKR